MLLFKVVPFFLGGERRLALLSVWSTTVDRPPCSFCGMAIPAAGEAFRDFVKCVLLFLCWSEYRVLCHVVLSSWMIVLCGCDVDMLTIYRDTFC
jgi:hypothetical protein